MKDRVRDITKRSGGRSMPSVIAELRGYLVGWKNYFLLADTPKVFHEIDEWIRHRLRAIQLKQWKRGVNEARIAEARALLTALAEEATVPEDLPTAEDEERRFAAAETALWDWYLEWSKVARIAIKQRVLLRKLGLLADHGADDQASDAEAVPAAAAPTTAAVAPTAVAPTATN